MAEGGGIGPQPRARFLGYKASPSDQLDALPSQRPGGCPGALGGGRASMNMRPRSLRVGIPVPLRGFTATQLRTARPLSHMGAERAPRKCFDEADATEAALLAVPLSCLRSVPSKHRPPCGDSIVSMRAVAPALNWRLASAKKEQTRADESRQGTVRHRAQEDAAERPAEDFGDTRTPQGQRD